MHEKPVCTALLPDSGVADLYFDGFAILCFFRKMHRDGGPCQRAAPHNFQVFAGGQTAAGHVGEEPFFNAVAIFLPAVIRERSYIVKDEAVVLGIIFGWRIGVAVSSTQLFFAASISYLCFGLGNVFLVRRRLANVAVQTILQATVDMVVSMLLLHAGGGVARSPLTFVVVCV